MDDELLELAASYANYRKAHAAEMQRLSRVGVEALRQELLPIIEEAKAIPDLTPTEQSLILKLERALA